MNCGVRRLSIDGLAPEIKNALIIGVIIAKQSINRFISKKDGLERGVWNFTVRDSPVDTINATWWGSFEGARSYTQMFSIGDVVEITNPRVQFLQPGDPNAKFRPRVSSPFEMELHEHHSEIIPHLEQDTQFIRELMHLPTKSPGDYLRLSDIAGVDQTMVGQIVNLLVIVAELGLARPVTVRRDSSTAICRDLVVLDQSARDFQITLWNEDIIHWSNTWKPRETVLFLADVRVDYNSYKRAVSASLTSFSIITVNPRIQEAQVLREYAKTVPVQPAALLDHLSSVIIDPSKIDSVMTTAQLTDKAFSGNTPGNQFTALLYAYVTRLDLDGSSRIVNFKCLGCGHIQENCGPCSDLGCVGGDHPQHPVFSLRLDLSDHRGTVTNCRLEGVRATRVLGCTEETFLALSLEQRTEHKWRYLLKRCEVRVVVLCAAPNRPAPLISVITCTVADPSIVAASLPVY